MSWREDELESLPTDTRQAVADGPVAPVTTQVMPVMDDQWQRDLDPSSFIRLLDEIDAGGMGQVLDAWDLDLRRPLAVKLLHARWRDRPEVRELFFIVQVLVLRWVDGYALFRRRPSFS